MCEQGQGEEIDQEWDRGTSPPLYIARTARADEGHAQVVPEDIEWNNTSKNPYQRKIGGLISWALTVGLIIIWSIPVAFVGGVSNIESLCTTASWLAWICTIPKAALGIIEGVLPPVLLAVLFALLPVVLRFWIKLSGVVRKRWVRVLGVWGGC